VGVAWSAQRNPAPVNLSFQDRSRYFFIQVAPQLSSRGWVHPVPDPLLLRKSGSAGNRSWDLWICSQKLWPLDHSGGRLDTLSTHNISIHTLVNNNATEQAGWWIYRQRGIYKRKQHHTYIQELHDNTNIALPLERLHKQDVRTSRRYPQEEWDLTGFNKN
jgi:hypothetical protein